MISGGRTSSLAFSVDLSSMSRLSIFSRRPSLSPLSFWIFFAFIASYHPCPTRIYPQVQIFDGLLHALHGLEKQPFSLLRVLDSIEHAEVDLGDLVEALLARDHHRFGAHGGATGLLSQPRAALACAQSLVLRHLVSNYHNSIDYSANRI